MIYDAEPVLSNLLSQILLNNMHSFGFESILLSTGFGRITDRDDGESCQFFRNIQDLTHFIHPFFHRRDPKPDRAKSEFIRL